MATELDRLDSLLAKLSTPAAAPSPGVPPAASTGPGVMPATPAGTVPPDPLVQPALPLEQSWALKQNDLTQGASVLAGKKPAPAAPTDTGWSPEQTISSIAKQKLIPPIQKDEGSRLDDILSKLGDTETPQEEELPGGVPASVLRGLNRRLLELEGMGREPDIMGQMVAPLSHFPRKVLEKLGVPWLQGEHPELADGIKVFDTLGIDYRKDESLAGHIGKNVMDSMFTLMGWQAAAEKLSAMGIDATSGAFKRLGQQLGEAMIKHPWLGVVGDLLGATPAATVGEEYFGPAGAMAGGVVGQVAVSGATIAAKYGIKLPQKVLGKIADAIDGFARLLGGPNAPASVTGRPQPIPTVSEHLLIPAREAEAKARIAGQAVTEAAERVRNAPPWTVAQMEAKSALKEAQAVESLANQRAEAYWNRLPEAARGPFSRETEAIRANFADTVMPKTFADTQLSGDRMVVESLLQDAFASVAPTAEGKTTKDFSTAIAEGVDRAEKAMTKAEGKYWKRVPLKAQMPNREPLSELEAFRERLRNEDGFTPNDMPDEHIKMFGDLFAIPENPSGQFQPPSFYNNALPTLAQVKGVITNLRSAARAERAKDGGGNFGLIANMAKLESMANDWIAQAFPKNVPLQQARAFSQLYHSLFTTSEMHAILATKRTGADRVHPEDVFEKLLSRQRGLEDLYKVTDTMLKLNRMPPVVEPFEALGGPGRQSSVIRYQRPEEHPPQNTASWKRATAEPVLSAEDRQSLVQLSQDTENGMRSAFQDVVEKNVMC